MEKVVEKEKLDLAQNPELIEDLVEKLSDDDKFMLLLHLIKDTNGYHFSEKLENSVDNFFVKNNLDLPTLEKLNLLYQKQISHYEASKNFQYYMKSFEKWNFEDVQIHFDIKRTDTLNTLNDWLEIQAIAIEEQDKTELAKLRYYLKNNVHKWNEGELKLFFISGLLKLVNYEKTDSYRPFAERKVSADLESLHEGVISISGNVDFMVSNGLATPRQPFFCIHEYKKEKGTSHEGDPLGQVLIAMHAVQELNKQKFPIYGAYVVGRHWYFVVLEKQEYAVSRSFDASEEGIFDIYKILKKLKGLIEDNL